MRLLYSSYIIVLLLVTGSYILRGTWLHDSCTDRNTAAGKVDWELHVVAKPSVGRHYPSCYTSECVLYPAIL